MGRLSGVVRAGFFGYPIDMITMVAQAVELAPGRRADGPCASFRCRCGEASLYMRRDPVLAADVAASDLMTTDGMGVVWGRKLLGLPACEIVTRIDLFWSSWRSARKRVSSPSFWRRRARRATDRWSGSKQNSRISGWPARTTADFGQTKSAKSFGRSGEAAHTVYS